MNVPGLLSTDADQVRGCKFCGTKTLTLAASGQEYWHAAVNCCAPSALLQITWRAQDARAIGDQLDATNNPSIRRDLERILADAQEDGRDALAAFQAYIHDEHQLQDAIRACRAKGYDYQFTHARAALMRHAA